MAVTAIIPEVAKEIKYNRDTRDYDCFITIDEHREYIGSASTYTDAERTCNIYVYDYYCDTNTPEKAAQIVSSVFVSSEVGDSDTLGYTPRLNMINDALTIRMGRLDDAAWEASSDDQCTNTRQTVQEVVHLRSRDVVVVVAETDIFIITAREYACQV